MSSRIPLMHGSSCPGVTSNPHLTTGYTSLVQGCVAYSARANGINFAGNTRARSSGWGAGYTSVCRLQDHPGVPQQRRVWVRGLIRTRQRAIPRCCAVVTLYEAGGGDGLQVIPCGSAACYTLRGIRRGCQRKPPKEEGMWRYSILRVYF